MRYDVIIVANVIHSDEDDVSESSSSATSNLQGLSNCVHQQPAVDLCQSNSNIRPTYRRMLHQTEPDVYDRSTDDLSARCEGQSASSLVTINESERTASDFQKQNFLDDTDVTETRNDPLLEHQINDANHLLANDRDFVTPEKRTSSFKFFEGIGPTDEDTGIPIASRTVSKTTFDFLFNLTPYS